MVVVSERKEWHTPESGQFEEKMRRKQNSDCSAGEDDPQMPETIVEPDTSQAHTIEAHVLSHVMQSLFAKGKGWRQFEGSSSTFV